MALSTVASPRMAQSNIRWYSGRNELSLNFITMPTNAPITWSSCSVITCSATALHSLARNCMAATKNVPKSVWNG